MAGELDLAVGGHLVAREDEHLPLEEGAVHGIEPFPGERGAEVEPGDLGSEASGEWAEVQALPLCRRRRHDGVHEPSPGRSAASDRASPGPPHPAPIATAAPSPPPSLSPRSAPSARSDPPCPSAPMKPFELAARDLVPHLPGRALHEVRARGLERPRETAFEPELRAAQRVDDHACAVRRVLDGEAKLDLERGVTESAPFEANERDLVVVLPGDVVGGADVDLARFEPLVELTLHRLGLRPLLRLETATLQHVEEVGVSARVDLVGAVDRHPAVREQAAEGADSAVPNGGVGAGTHQGLADRVRTAARAREGIRPAGGRRAHDGNRPHLPARAGVPWANPRHRGSRAPSARSGSVRCGMQRCPP